MALLADDRVEEWRNRQGFFAIRGLEFGGHETDLLALRPRPDGKLECRDTEVKASMQVIGRMAESAALENTG